MVELGFGIQIIYVQAVAPKSPGLSEATCRIFPAVASVRGTPRSQISEDLVQHGHQPLDSRGNASWRIQDHPPHPHQLTQVPRTVMLSQGQPSIRARGNIWLLFLQQPPQNGTVLQPPQQTSVFYLLKPWAQHPKEIISLPGGVQGGVG